MSGLVWLPLLLFLSFGVLLPPFPELVLAGGVLLLFVVMSFPELFRLIGAFRSKLPFSELFRLITGEFEVPFLWGDISFAELFLLKDGDELSLSSFISLSSFEGGFFTQSSFCPVPDLFILPVKLLITVFLA
jgi:hypothetical protein